jgi:hypothetical protein
MSKKEERKLARAQLKPQWFLAGCTLAGVMFTGIGTIDNVVHPEHSTSTSQVIDCGPKYQLYGGLEKIYPKAVFKPSDAVQNTCDIIDFIHSIESPQLKQLPAPTKLKQLPAPTKLKQLPAPTK